MIRVETEIAPPYHMHQPFYTTVSDKIPLTGSQQQTPHRLLKTEYGYRLTTQCPAMMENDPVLYPSWRGQHDDWARFGCVYPDNPTTNLAIVGLFRYIDPESAEAKQLEADGYTRQDWGKTLLSTGTQETDNVRKEYTEYPFIGYTDADLAAKNPPLYLMPFSSTALEQDPSLTNGYGFSN